MSPTWRHGRQRFQYKAPLDQPRMGQYHRPLVYAPVVIQEVQVQAARSVGNGTLAPEASFDFMQKCQQSKGLKPGFASGNRVEKRRIARTGPSFGFIKRRNTNGLKPSLFQRLERSTEGFGGWARRGRNISAKRD